VSADTESSAYAALGCAHTFATTHWSVVLGAAQSDAQHSVEALEKLCRSYWYPIYSFIRRRGHDPEAARDLTQEFFSRLLEKNYLLSVDASKGRFRSFLLAAVTNFLSNEWDRAHRLKRGGGCAIFSLDAVAAEDRYLLEPVCELTPERVFEQRWVDTLLETVLTRLRQECRAQGQGERFEQLKGYLVEDGQSVAFAEMAERLQVTEASVKGVVRRLRERYREIFREEIANTVADPQEVEPEIRHLLRVLSG
jgi:RNA polymerase sigma-70 factor (ECF subfamily)